MKIGVTSDQKVTTVNEGIMIAIPLGFVLAVGGAAIAANIMCGWGRVKSFSWSWNSVRVICK